MANAPTIADTIRAFFAVEDRLRTLAIELSRRLDVAKTDSGSICLARFPETPIIDWYVEAYRSNGRVFVWGVDASWREGTWTVSGSLGVNEPDDPNGTITLVRIDDRVTDRDDVMLTELVAAANEVALIEMPD